MNINGLFGTQGTTPASSSTAVTPPSPVAGGNSASAVGAAATAAISTPAQFMSQMQQLSQTDPSQFKAVAASVATSFQNAAAQASGSQAQVLTGLASQFTQAAQTGTLPAPQASAPVASVQGAQGASAGHAGAHHHHHGGGASATQSSSVQEAFQDAMNVLSQATQGTSSSTSSST